MEHLPTEQEQYIRQAIKDVVCPRQDRNIVAAKLAVEIFGEGTVIKKFDVATTDGIWFCYDFFLLTPNGKVEIREYSVKYDDECMGGWD